MFEPSEIDKEVNRVVSIMSNLEPDSIEYKNAAESLRLLCESRTLKSSRALNPEAILYAITNILGIVLIISYEQLHPLTSKALGLIKK